MKKLMTHLSTGLLAVTMFAAVAAPVPDAYKRAPERDPGVSAAAVAPAPDGYRKAPLIEGDVYKRP